MSFPHGHIKRVKIPKQAYICQLDLSLTTQPRLLELPSAQVMNTTTANGRSSADPANQTQMLAWEKATFTPSCISDQVLISGCPASKGSGGEDTAHSILFEYGDFVQESGVRRAGWQIMVGRDDDVRRASNESTRGWNPAGRIIGFGGEVTSENNYELCEKMTKSMVATLCDRYCKESRSSLEIMTERGKTAVWFMVEDGSHVRTMSAVFKSGKLDSAVTETFRSHSCTMHCCS
jgi:hypothetical protein